MNNYNIMNEYLLYIPMEDYLAQWFINQCGACPCILQRGSIESKILETFLTKLPPGESPDLPAPGKLGIVIPSFKMKPAQYYCHLPRHATNLLISTLRNRFDIQLFSEIYTFANQGARIDQLIYAWMEKHGIETTEKNWCTISKRFQRLRDNYNKKNLRKQK